MKDLDLVCQRDAISILKDYADNKSHSILIEGPESCGKSYLANKYGKSMLNIEDIFIVQPNVNSIRTVIEDCYRFTNPIVIVIENLDLGVKSASYALLKFLEEPASHVYIVVTCRNINNIPDTIVSRCLTVSCAPPIDSDIEQFASAYNFDKYYTVSKKSIWKCVHTFNDAIQVLDMTPEQFAYFDSLNTMSQFRDTISNMMWKLGHYNDNSETPINLVIEYLMTICNNKHIERAGIQCIRDLSSGRVASHAVIAKFLFEAKYCE